MTDMNGKVDLSGYRTTLVIGASRFKQGLWYITNGLFFINPLNPFSGVKVFLLRLFGAQIGKGVVIKPAVNIKYPWKLEISDHVWIGEKVWIDNLDRVTIKEQVCISQGALLLCGSHNYKSQGFDLITAPILLEEGVWISARAIVTGGVCCRSHSVLTAGSVAKSELEAYTVYQGNPAVKVRKRVIG
jgi:putative colanic acid biosynthesis acetyltransferase WcaF